jgi:hypothetical protein
MLTLTRSNVEQANETLARELRAEKELNAGLRTQLSNQAKTIIQLREEADKAKTTTLVVKNPQHTIESHRATIDQQRKRIHEQNGMLRDLREEVAHNDDLIRYQKQAILRLQETVVNLCGELDGQRNAIQREQRLSQARLHHIASLESILSEDRQVVSTEQLCDLVIGLERLVELAEEIGDVVHEELDSRTRNDCGGFF